MTALVCGHPTPAGPCTRKVLSGAGGCGYHPAPPDRPEERHPEPMASCDCERPLVLGRPYDDMPPRCFLCTRPVEVLLNAEGGPGQVDQISARAKANGVDDRLHDDPVQAHNDLLLGLLGLKEQDE